LEWTNALAKRAKSTGRNYSRLLYLYWTQNQRFRAFKSTAQWLDEVREQQKLPGNPRPVEHGERNLKHSISPTKANPVLSHQRARTILEPQS
jgi:hypothetical protein